MYNFCTLFDSNYIARGLVTYESLMKATNGNTHLYVFAFDEKCYSILKGMALPNLTVISLAEFEDEELLKVKPTRSRGEYCWTCTSSTILYCIETLGLSNCTYIDADMYFYTDPKVLIDEMPDGKHVLITEHRYTPQYDKSKLSGKYCVQFMYFDNSKEGLEVLRHWRNQCLEWCYNRHEDGKFGDQKYLDVWTQQYSCVHELVNLGGGLAPWNIQRFELNYQTGLQLRLINVKGLDSSVGYSQNMTVEPIFFHFHGVKIFENDKTIYAPKMYILTEKIDKAFYQSYCQKLKEAQKKLIQYDSSLKNLGVLSVEEYAADRKKGWFAWFKTNYINPILGLKF